MPSTDQGPVRRRIARAGTIATGVIAGLVLVPALAGATTKTDLRVVTYDGRELADVRQYTDTANIPTSPAAKCFFGGAGGSGKPTTIQGPTALGAAVDAASNVRSLNPILITDEFSFGLGICGFGGITPSPSEFWQVRVNHYALQVGGDQVFLGGGHKVLWALVPAPNCPPPSFICQPTLPELELRAPARAKPGKPFPVRVTEYSDTGAASPAGGVAVTGAAALTDAGGLTSVTLGRSKNLVAYRPEALPSQRLRVCVSRKAGAKKGAGVAKRKKPGRRSCAGRHGRAIFGTDREDGIGGTKGPDRIKALGDDDTIRVRGGNRDKVHCGGGVDLVFADAKDKISRRSCERIIRARKGKGKRKRG